MRQLLPSTADILFLLFSSGGVFRNVFLLDKHDSDPNLILKVAQTEMDYDVRMYEYMRMEGGVNAALPPHPRLVSIHGFCALSMFNEAVMGGNVEDFALP